MLYVWVSHVYLQSAAYMLSPLLNTWASLFLFLAVTWIKILIKKGNIYIFSTTAAEKLGPFALRLPFLSLPLSLFSSLVLCVWIYFCLLGLNLAVQLLILFLWSRQEGNKTNAFTVLHSGALQWYYSTEAINVQWHWGYQHCGFSWMFSDYKITSYLHDVFEIKNVAPPLLVWTELSISSGHWSFRLEELWVFSKCFSQPVGEDHQNDKRNLRINFQMI